MGQPHSAIPGEREVGHEVSPVGVLLVREAATFEVVVDPMLGNEGGMMPSWTMASFDRKKELA